MVFLRKLLMRSGSVLSRSFLYCIGISPQYNIICCQIRHGIRHLVFYTYRLKGLPDLPTTKTNKLTWGRTLMTHWAGRWEAMRATISHGRDSKPEGDGLPSGVVELCLKFNLGRRSRIPKHTKHTKLRQYLCSPAINPQWCEFQIMKI